MRLWTLTNLLWQHLSSKVLERELELLGLATEQDLDHDGRVQRYGYIGRHGANEADQRSDGTGGLEKGGRELVTATINGDDAALV